MLKATIREQFDYEAIEREEEQKTEITAAPIKQMRVVTNEPKEPPKPKPGVLPADFFDEEPVEEKKPTPATQSAPQSQPAPDIR
jgi:hypothetical protein